MLPRRVLFSKGGNRPEMLLFDAEKSVSVGMEKTFVRGPVNRLFEMSLDEAEELLRNRLP
jgi:hypothetical protein